MTPEERAKKITLIGYKDRDALVQHMRKQAATAIRAAVEEERKECSTIADSYDGIYHNTARHIAAAIRARGKAD